jgi:uncharacterized protein (TIGR02231 family)
MNTAKLTGTLLSLAIVAACAGVKVETARAQAAPRPAGAAPAAAAAAVPVAETVLRGKVDAVTVYRGQALVTRAVDLPAGAGMGEFVISELPERLIAGSLFAEGSDGVEVRSVRFRTRPIAQDVREEVRRLDEQIQAVQDRLGAIEKQKQLLGEQRAYLDKLAAFAAPTATTELTRGVLNADQLKNLTNYQFETRKSIVEQELALQQDERRQNEQLNLLTRQKGDVTGRSSRTLREAVVFINRERPGGNLRLRYLVDAATWSPSFNVRADAEKQSASLEYLASITQMSGEDWGDVSMALSTATPSLVATAPPLKPLHIALGTQVPANLPGRGGMGTAAEGLDYSQVQRGITAMRQNVENQRGSNIFNEDNLAKAREEQDKNDRALNRVADQLQVLELITRDSKGEARLVDSTEGVVVTYQLRTRTSLPSRSDRQLIQIEQLPMKSQFYKVAVPVLSSYVYDEAELTNTSAIVLLAGPVSSYVGGQYVGSGALSTVAVGQHFTVGFGIDPSLRATRERLQKSEQTQGGNRIVNFSYRLALENFGTRAADVRLMDRLPVGKESDVRVTFSDAEAIKISQDREYQSNDYKKGILRWDVQVPAQRNGSDALAIDYKLSLEHDKSLAISTSGLLGPEMQQFFQQ